MRTRVISATTISICLSYQEILSKKIVFKVILRFYGNLHKQNNVYFVQNFRQYFVSIYNRIEMLDRVAGFSFIFLDHLSALKTASTFKPTGFGRALISSAMISTVFGLPRSFETFL